MSLKLNFSLNQKLVMSQRLHQSLSILSLSGEELNQMIQEELLENPLLEAVESPSSLADKREEERFFRMSDYSSKGSSFSQSSSAPLPEDFLSEPISLQSHLLRQAEVSFFPKSIKLLLPLLISHLDERAYLNLDLEALSKNEEIPLSLLKEALRALQSLEPAGVGGRDLKECLLIQLRQKKEDTKKAQIIVQNHLQYIREKKYRAIAFDLDISMKETLRLCRLIQSLEPHPARNFSSQPTVFIQPDIYIYKKGRDYQALLNTEGLPQLKFSKSYAESIISHGNLKKPEKKYLREKSSSARWFIWAIQQRQEKIQKIASYLISYQRDFLEKGLSHIKPLRMQDMAEELELHTSTISRTIQNKYAHTPQGIIALKDFFQKGIMNQDGLFVSIAKIKESIKRWVEEEDPERPLSDSQIGRRISEVFSVHLLRRSVGQYRASMDIPPLKIRKLHFLNSLRQKEA